MPPIEHPQSIAVVAHRYIGGWPIGGWPIDA